MRCFSQRQKLHHSNQLEFGLELHLSYFACSFCCLHTHSCHEGALVLCKCVFLMRQYLQDRLAYPTGKLMTNDFVTVDDAALSRRCAEAVETLMKASCSFPQHGSSFSPSSVANIPPAAFCVAAASAATARAVSLCPCLLDDFVRVEAAWASMSQHYRNIYCSFNELDQLAEKVVLGEFLCFFFLVSFLLFNCCIC